MKTTNYFDDANDRVIGIEIEDASQFIELSRFEISALPIASLVLNDRMPAGEHSRMMKSEVVIAE
ncbi:MAG: hypothetical protein B6243_09960 [Anaerolineaceae bacterium 4572_5.2]|nr:MAG: hypothetical protein B6243_09960 [Anaerolineaceae bacterium 4572_5.2]